MRAASTISAQQLLIFHAVSTTWASTLKTNADRILLLLFPLRPRAIPLIRGSTSSRCAATSRFPIRARARSIDRADADFVEAKGYVFVGDSRRRMTLDNMPSHDSVRVFAGKLAECSGYDVRDEQHSSRVVLLARPGMGSTRIPGK